MRSLLGEWSDDEGESPLYYEKFTEFHNQILDCLKKYEKVVIKLGWNSPKDAFWMIPFPYCTSPEEIYSLLKGSDRVKLALNMFEDLNCDPILYIYKFDENWENSKEFRVFIRNSEVVGICQRIDTEYFPHLQENEIIKAVSKFMKSMKSCKDIVLDIYLEENKTVIVDCAPFDLKWIDPILFKWDELETTEQPLIRLINSNDKCRSKMARYNFLFK